MHATGAPAVAHIKQNDCGPAHGKAIIGLPDTPAIPSVDDSINFSSFFVFDLWPA